MRDNHLLAFATGLAALLAAIVLTAATLAGDGRSPRMPLSEEVFAAGSIGPQGAGGTVQLFVLPPPEQREDPYQMEPLLTVDADEQGSFAIELPEDLLQFDTDGVHDFFVLGMSPNLEFEGTAYFSMLYSRDHEWSPAEESSPLHLVVNLHENEPEAALEDYKRTTGQD